MSLTISEVSSQFSNKGNNAGSLVTFIEFYGCNNFCTYCSERNVRGKSKIVSVDTVTRYVSKLGNEHVVIGGGEPLIQDEMYPLLYELVDRGYKVTVHTKGAVDFEPTYYKRSYNLRLEVKLSSSGTAHKRVIDNITKLQGQDELYFRIQDEIDYYEARNLVRKYHPKSIIIFEGITEEMKEKLPTLIMSDRILRARIAL